MRSTFNVTLLIGALMAPLYYTSFSIKSAAFALLSCVGGFLFGAVLTGLTYKFLDT